MKCNFLASAKNIFRNAFFVTVITVLGTNSVNAKNNPALPSVGSISCVSTSNFQSSFVVNYENESGEKFVVSVVDSEGVTLFDDVFTDKKFNKTFMVPAEVGNVTFTITSYKNKTEKKFQATTVRRMVQDIVIDKQ